MIERPLAKRTAGYIAHGAPEGQRKEELLAAACQCRDAGHSQAESESLLLPRAMRDGLPEQEARRTIASAYSKPARQPLRVSGSGTIKGPGITAGQRQRIEAQKRTFRIEARATAAANAVLREYRCGVADYAERSPVDLFSADPTDDWRLLLRLFQPDDVMWIAATTKHSANDQHGEHWREFCRTRFRPASGVARRKGGARIVHLPVHLQARHGLKV